MTNSPDPLNPSSSPERREQTEAFLEWWAKGAAVSIYGSSWYDIGLAAWLAACDYSLESRGFRGFVQILDDFLTHYPPDSIVCSNAENADAGARFTAALRTARERLNCKYLPIDRLDEAGHARLGCLCVPGGS
jgi:hypothetical protein